MAEVQDAIEAMGITSPTPIQRLAIGPVLEGRDVIAKAETGTGKTLAFGAPMMSRIDPARASVLGLVLCPTRELAQQVAGVIEKLGASRKIRVALVVGGEPINPQVEALKAGAQVVVGTPGRVIDLYGQKFLSFPWTETVVLDEADEMFEIGFIDDVKKILSYTPDERQTLLFSATFPPEVLALARASTRNPLEIATAAGVATVKTIDQGWMQLLRDDRSLALTRLIEQSNADDVFLVFCDRRTEVDSLMRQLERMPFSVKALHGGYDQAARFRVMSAFRTGEVKALVATDVASRGLDVHQVTHVINYSVPRDVQDYTHRIGRTGRAGRSGTAITFVTPDHAGRWRDIERTAPWKIEPLELPGRTSRSSPRRETRAPREPVEADVPQAPAPIEAPVRAPREARPPRESRERVHAPRRQDASRRAPAAPTAPLPRSQPVATSTAGPAQRGARNAAPATGERPRREMTTRERLALERQGAERGDAPPARESAPAPERGAAPRRASRPPRSREPRARDANG